MAGRTLALHWQILIGLALGAVVGVSINVLQDPLQALLGTTGPLRTLADSLVSLNSFVGDLFLRGLRFVAVPIVLFSLVVGASTLNDLQRLSRIGGRTVGLYLITTAVAISIGLALANLTQPGTWIPAELRDALAATNATAAATKIGSAEGAPDVWQTLLSIVPQNPFEALAKAEMLQVVFLALAVGVALTLIPDEKARPVIQLADSLNEVVLKLVHVLMLLAPLAVFTLIARVLATLGLDVLVALLVYSLTVVAGLALMMVGVYGGLLRILAGVPLLRFFDAIAPAQLLAFSSSSSSATLPVTMECVEERLGVREDITAFVIPLGATVNMDGTALYQGVATLFIAQLYGIQLGFTDQLTVVLTATLASIGTAGVPGVGIVMLVIVLQSVNIPVEAMTGGIAILFGVDRILDMCRTVTNITGDCMVAAVVAKQEGALLSAEEVRRRLAHEDRVGLDERP